MNIMSTVARLRRVLGIPLLAATLAGCGGGLWIGYSDFDNGDLPQVSLVANVDSAVPGQTIRLSAAASDDDGIDEVRFYRVLSDGGVLRLGDDDGEPYQWDTVVPSTSASQVRYFARAFDRFGNWNDSGTVSVTLR
jgi:hypothetical protein